MEIINIAYTTVHNDNIFVLQDGNKKKKNNNSHGNYNNNNRINRYKRTILSGIIHDTFSFVLTVVFVLNV